MSLTPTQVTDTIAEYLAEKFNSEDAFLEQLQHDAAAEGIPPISIGGIQGAFLQVLLRAMNAKYVLEIGSLAGYSALTMAKVLPEGGKVVCMEFNPDFAAFIRRKADEAGLGGKIEVHTGDAKETLRGYAPDFEFDFVFIDADKPGYTEYLSLTYPLVRKGGIIAGDNALAWGYVADEEPSFEPETVWGIQNFNQALSQHPGILACLVPTMEWQWALSCSELRRQADNAACFDVNLALWIGNFNLVFPKCRMYRKVEFAAESARLI